MALTGLRSALAVMVALIIAGAGGGTDARMNAVPDLKAPYSHVPGPLHRAGLWDKPNEVCTQKCQTFVQKGCFRRLLEKDPAADPGSIQDRCDDMYSLCIYDCMCDTCDENQIIIKQQ